MKIALLQTNPTVGDLAGNARLVQEAAHMAASSGADLLVTSELVLSGYPPKDLLSRQGFVAACDRWIDQLAGQLPKELGVVVGHPTQRDCPQGRIANAASLIHEGKVLATIHKRLLPNYDVFDERRYFRPAQKLAPIPFRGEKLGIHICEDAWFHDPATFYATDPELLGDPVAELGKQGATLLINLSASPFEVGKSRRRHELMAYHARHWSIPFLFADQIGGNDDLVFDGQSFVLDANGACVATLPAFRRGLLQVDTQALPPRQISLQMPVESDLHEALVLGIRDYCHKSGFTDCVLGLSGGVDSALVAYLAARALGAEHVHGLLLPSRYSTDHSLEDAILLAERLKIDHCTIPIDAVHRAYETIAVLGEELASKPAGLADQNLQSRIRGAIVMARSNHHGWLALATGNKSELAMGYCTLYGDMNGALAPLGDLYKGEVYRLCEFINQQEGKEIIPANILTKPPSAELAPNQFDQDTLPPYDLLDEILRGLIDREESVAALSHKFPASTVEWVARRLDRNEYKRWQMPPGIKVSPRAFGVGRRMPMAARCDGDWA
ncbi:Glutamine-dependent NAD(+) synthetase [Planctopirus ephydatiae]|uniref:Glutamine-dependent NAD(+) synthetase n=1 Tax=Planctopirus ephydatiae TaxID=2528019 RepID=A0A518GTZ4_9PLAN|nr:NAD+ synthase [Planctopirus ephydatiae]QDV32050.1 Glutamine-dependent NAD(+) synthetase [Planctopirus ephydatiae]